MIMRIFSIVVAALALVAGLVCVSIVSKFRVMYQEIGAPLPDLTTMLLNTSGWIPGGILLLLAVLVLALVAARQQRIAGGLAGVTLLFLVGVAAVVPRLLIAPLVPVIQRVEASEKNQAAEQAVPPNGP